MKKKKGWHYVVKNARELVQEIDLDLETEFSFQFKYGYIFPFLFFYFLIFFFRLLYQLADILQAIFLSGTFLYCPFLYCDLVFVITCFSLFFYIIFCHPSEDLIFPIEFSYIYQIVFHSVLLLSIFALVPFWYLECHWYLWSNTSS